MSTMLPAPSPYRVCIVVVVVVSKQVMRVGQCDVQPMPEIEQNGPDFKYIVTYKRLDQDGALEHIATVGHAEAWHYVVPDHNLGIYKPFLITVKANNARGDSVANLLSVVGYSGEDGQIQRCCFHRCLYYMFSVFRSYSVKLDFRTVCYFSFVLAL